MRSVTFSEEQMQFLLQSIIFVFGPKVTYMALFPEDIPPNKVILKMSAQDADIGSNGEIRYSLYGSGNNKFFLDPESGKNFHRDAFILTLHCWFTAGIVANSVLSTCNPWEVSVELLRSRRSNLLPFLLRCIKRQYGLFWSTVLQFRSS